MKHFLYTFSGTPPDGHIQKTVRIYRIIRNTPAFVVKGTDTFVDEFQLALAVMEENKLLPKAAFVRNPDGSYKHTETSLVEAGIASVILFDI